VRLHVEAQGPEDGAPVVFLHGVSGSMRTYAWLPGEIVDGRRIVRLDLRGHGRSEHAPGRYDVDATARTSSACCASRSAGPPCSSSTRCAAELAAAPFGPDRSRTSADGLSDDVPAALAEALLRMDTGVLEGIADRSTLAPTDTTAPVSVPVFVLAADDEKGAAFPTRHAERLAMSHPDVEIVRVAGAGHGIHDERDHRDDYVAALTRFLATHA
jgi:pimeloyl-ACP methyl ester carboxylesterase